MVLWPRERIHRKGGIYSLDLGKNTIERGIPSSEAARECVSGREEGVGAMVGNKSLVVSVQRRSRVSREAVPPNDLTTWENLGGPGL